VLLRISEFTDLLMKVKKREISERLRQRYKILTSLVFVKMSVALRLVDRLFHDVLCRTNITNPKIRFPPIAFKSDSKLDPDGIRIGKSGIRQTLVKSKS